jgi:hypothetical protein
MLSVGQLSGGWILPCALGKAQKAMEWMGEDASCYGLNVCATPPPPQIHKLKS